MRDDLDLRTYYERFDEDGRLDAGPFQLEFERTKEIIGRRLGDPPQDVLDIGGGPGRYAVWLAAAGHRVQLVDLMPHHVDQARARAQRVGAALSATVGDARELQAADGSVDAVLLLGPLYHLTEASDRAQALGEARRVLRPDGLLVAAGISRFASTLAALWTRKVQDPEFAPIFERDLQSGQHRNDSANIDYFTTAYFHRPPELADEIDRAGFAVVETIAVEGPLWMIPDFEARWSDRVERAKLLEILRKIEREPSMLGVSAHLLVVARKPRTAAADGPRTAE